MKQSLKRETGVGLLEVMIALLVVAMGTLGVIRIHASVLDANCNAKALGAATALAQMEFERVRTFLPAAICNAGDPDEPADENFDIAGGFEGVDPANAASCTNLLNTQGGLYYSVTVTSNSCKEAGQTYSFRSFLRPFDPSIFTASGGGNAAVPQPAVAKRLNDTVGKADGDIPAEAKRPTGVAIVPQADGSFILYVKRPDGRYYGRIESNVELLEVSGIIASRDAPISELALNMQLLTTAVGFCQFPLKYTNANDHTTYVLDVLPTGTKSAAYVCFVPTGWYGNIALDINASKQFACPDEPDNVNLVGGTRSIKAVFSQVVPPSSNDDIVGQSGILKYHETNGQTRKLHYVVYGANNPVRCQTAILNKGSGNNAPNNFITATSHGSPSTSYVISSQGYGGLKQYREPSPTVAGLKGVSCSTDGSCLRPRDYWLEVNGALTVAGTLSTTDLTIDMNDVQINISAPNPFTGVVASACAVTVANASSASFSCLTAPSREVVLSVANPTGVTISNTDAVTVTVGSSSVSGIALELKR